MRRVRISLVLVLGVLALGTVATGIAVSQNNFNTDLTSDEEVPVAVSEGKGRAVIRISKDESQLSFNLIVNHVDGITQAHIHCGAEGVAGPVVAFLFGFVAEGVTQNGLLSSGVITDANVIARPDSAACPGGVASLADVIAKIRSGDAYVNVHTLENPPGEIRGQLD